jgi:hypothetical protein
MAKLEKCTYPGKYGRDDFKCHGPVATKDTEFKNCRLADLGCFKQEGVDSNKYYHNACVTDPKGTWYLYSEWGKTKDGIPDKPQFQFTECLSESEAMDLFVKQCESKNTKRGKWEQVGSKQRYVAKGKDDLYLVRVLASRAVGLPDAKNIANQDAIKEEASDPKKKVTIKPVKPKIDLPTRKLFHDLLGGTLQYARTNLVGGTLPSQTAIDDARDLLSDAQKQLTKVGDDVADQVADPTIKKLTYAIYSMVPKTKKAGAPESTWILSNDNIVRWEQDLDAFESALKTGKIEETENDDVMKGIPADVSWVDPKTEFGAWIYQWWVDSTNQRKRYGRLKVHNIWKVDRHGDMKKFEARQRQILETMPAKWNNERPLFQPKERPDLTKEQKDLYWKTNTALLFHGTPSQNCAGIIRESLRLPRAYGGSLFGPGIYEADDWEKSSWYCSIGIRGRHNTMFACDFIAGVPHIQKTAKQFKEPPAGHHCVFGKAGVTESWGRAGGLLNN